MSVLFRATANFMRQVHKDLLRPHPFAAERVGFISVRAAKGQDQLVLLAENYHPVADDDYVPDLNVGAMMGQEAIRKALEIALLQSVGMIHVHVHEHYGPPRFSPTDLREQLKFVPDFFKLRPQMPHGAIVLSYDRAIGRIWLAPHTIIGIDEFNIVSSRLTVDRGTPDGGFNFLA